jgi:hypothetical protein
MPGAQRGAAPDSPDRGLRSIAAHRGAAVPLRLRLRFTTAWGPLGAGAMSGEDHLLHEILGTGHPLPASIVLAQGTPHAVRSWRPGGCRRSARGSRRCAGGRQGDKESKHRSRAVSAFPSHRATAPPDYLLAAGGARRHQPPASSPNSPSSSSWAAISL